MQFNAAMRKLFADTLIYCSERTNCTDLIVAPQHSSYSNITKVSSRQKMIIHETEENFTPEDLENVVTELSENQQVNETSARSDLSDVNIAYIASKIEMKIENSTLSPCVLCKSVFGENELVAQAYLSTNHTRRACQSTMDICKVADHFIRLQILKGQFSSSLIQETIISSLNTEELYRNTNFFEHQHSKTDLMKTVLMEYIRYKGNHIARTATAEEIQEQVRRKLSRVIINKNQ